MLTDNGFVPSVIIIHRGDTIVFKSKTGKQFWPASNHHPIHELNPEFDPKHPLDPDKEWSFTFNKQGIWEFHDHLNSATRGIITVD